MKDALSIDGITMPIMSFTDWAVLDTKPMPSLSPYTFSGSCTIDGAHGRAFFDALQPLTVSRSMALHVTYKLPARWVAVRGRIKPYRLRYEKSRLVRDRFEDVTFKRDGDSIVGRGWWR